MGRINDSNGKAILSEEDLKVLLNYLESIKFGSITLIVRDSQIVGIEKNEKIKLK